MEVWSDRGSTCKFLNARSAFRNLHMDPLSLHTSMRNKQVEFDPYIYNLSKLYRFGYEISVFNTNTWSLFYGRHYSSLHRLMSLHGKLNVKIFLNMFIGAVITGSVNIWESIWLQRWTKFWIHVIWILTIHKHILLSIANAPRVETEPSTYDEDLLRMLKDTNHSDVTFLLKGGKHRVTAHRFMVCAVSKLFCRNFRLSDHDQVILIHFAFVLKNNAVNSACFVIVSMILFIMLVTKWLGNANNLAI